MLKTRLRLVGIVILVAAFLFSPRSQVPDIMLSEDGRAIAIKSTDDRLAMLYPRRNKFVRDIWLRAFSGDERVKVNAQGRCDKELCTAKTLQGAWVYVVYDPDLLALACNRADILLAPKLRWVNCRERKPTLVIKRGQLEEFGAHAIYLEKSSANTLPAKVPNPVVTRSLLLDKQESSPQTIASSADAGFHVARIETAITQSNRPWNRHERAGRPIVRIDLALTFTNNHCVDFYPIV